MIANKLFFFFAGFVLGFVIIFVTFIIKDGKIKNNIYPNVYVDEFGFGGKSKQDLIDFYDKKSADLKKSVFTILYKDVPIATFSAALLKMRYDSRTLGERAYHIGRSSNFSSRYYQKIASLFNLQRFEFESQIDFDQNIINDFIYASEEKYNKPAKNALFRFENGRVISFRKEEEGQELESELFLQDLKNRIEESKKSPGNKNIRLTSAKIKPEITLSQINSFGIEELIAEGKSDFSHSIPERIHNLTLAASKFDGVLIPKNETFSFNQAVGDISSLTGYKPAYIIKDGKTILGDGGGVCQVSTTLFRAALNAGLPIVERYAHAYRVGYYENDSKPGFDATVFAPSVDLKIKNNTPASILIQTEVDSENNLLYFRFYGKKDDRKVEISPAVLYDVVPPLEPKYQDDPTLKKGVTKQVDFPAWGGKAYFGYKVTINKKLAIDEKFYSVYRPWQAVYLVGTAE